MKDYSHIIGFREESRLRFTELAKAKYDHGQQEHGGLITDRDMLAELENEIIDLWFYEISRQLKAQLLGNDWKREPEWIRDFALRKFRSVGMTAPLHSVSLIEEYIVKLWDEVQGLRKRASL